MSAIVVCSVINVVFGSLNLWLWRVADIRFARWGVLSANIGLGLAGLRAVSAI